ncbi:pirin family protein [Zavarzinia sp. CC-PAN008]|uniref:pirin family protein n=1 Tax=Zavarzinia sp. CC-PAN008 TaxID=3243332 RepID=UPI003F74A39A
MELAIPARRHQVGGFVVGRVLPYMKRRMVGPFVFFDHMGPVTFKVPLAPDTDVRPHPHIGLSTVTYLFDGEITHRDSTGVEQVIRPGAVNWMTAGRGISHSERFDGIRAQGGGMVEGIQAWVALPEQAEEVEPGFDHYAADDLPLFKDAGIEGRLIAGSAYGLSSGVRTHSPLFYAHLKIAGDTPFDLPRGHAERAIYVARGAVEHEGQRVDPGQMLVFGPDEDPYFRTARGAEVMVLGGEPLGERFIWWNFVSSRPERIEQAKADWQAGRIPLPPMDHDEMIPLP